MRAIDRLVVYGVLSGTLAFWAAIAYWLLW